MKRMVLLFVCLLPFAAQAFTITGRVTGGSGVRIAAALPVELDTFYVGIVIPFINTYSITVPGGNYIVAAFQDVNLNGNIDAGEPIGWWGGEFPDALPVSGNVSGINITLGGANGGSFSGLLSYNGALSGAGFVRVYDNSSFTGTPVGGGLLFQNSTGNGSYAGITIVQGTFWAEAYMDMNGNLEPDANEPYGVFGGATPQSFAVTSTNSPANISILLNDPYTPPVENLTVSSAGSDIILRWNYSGPYSVFRIYRSTNPDVLPVATAPLTSTAGMSFTDFGAVDLFEQAGYQVVVIR